MTEPFLEDPRGAASLATPETQRRVAELNKRLYAWRDVEDHEHRMALAELNDNTYHTSGRYAEDALNLQRLRRYAEEA